MLYFRCILSVIFFTILFYSSTQTLYGQTIRYVKEVGIGSRDGSSWENASADLQGIINGSSAGDEVWVAQGSYRPSTFFSMKEGVKIYGGFSSSGAPQQNDRDWKRYTTVLQGNGNRVINNNSNGLTAATVLDGFTITNGFTSVSGAGIHNANVSPTFKNLIITNNSANGFGGGVYNGGNSNPSFVNVEVYSNQSSLGGGGVANNNSSPTFINAIIRNNRNAQQNGGGGGIYNTNNSSSTLINVVISGNSTVMHGGAMLNLSGVHTLINVTISANRSDRVTSWGISNQPSASLQIYNSIIHGNGSSNIVGQIQGSSSNNIIGGMTTPGVDPLFLSTDPASIDYLRLSENSPAIDAGNNTHWQSLDAGTMDLDGNPRVYDFENGGTIDLGAYEFQGYYGGAVRVGPDSNNILYVNKNTSGGVRSGDSWANALHELADALKWAHEHRNSNLWNAERPLQIWVANGTYKPMYSPRDGANLADEGQDNAFLLVRDVKVFGGFTGAETGVEQRINLPSDKVANGSTILSGDINGDDTQSGSGNALVFGNRSDNMHHVVLSVGDVGTAELNGFEVRGGGSAATSGSLNVQNQTIYKNFGGGIHMLESSPTISHTVIVNNQANYGGGIYARFSNHTMSYVAIHQNNAIMQDGGAMHSEYSSPLWTNVSVTDNRASRDAGGINNVRSAPTFNYMVISGNFAGSTAGGISNSYSNSVLLNVDLINNLSEGPGGAIVNNSSSPVLTNVKITGNRGRHRGGAIVNNSASHPILTNVTITGNNVEQGSNGGIHHYMDASSIIRNSIVWGNGVRNIENEQGGRIHAESSNNLIEGSEAVGNLDNIPQGLRANDIFKGFVSATTSVPTADGDFRLNASSIAINRGSNVMYWERLVESHGQTGEIPQDLVDSRWGVDLMGNPRILGTSIDLGAYEAAFVPVTPDVNNILYVNQQVVSGNASGSSWTNAIPELAEALKWAKDHESVWTEEMPLQIWVARGIYKPKYLPDVDRPIGVAERNVAFDLVRNVKVYGGFVGNETGLRERNWSINSTILSGDIGVENVISDNALHVVTSIADVGTAELDGFVIRDGNADGLSSYWFSDGIRNYTYNNSGGGGVYICTSAPRLRNLEIRNNSGNWGGGIRSNVFERDGQRPGGTPAATLQNVLIVHNRAHYSGAAIYNNRSPLQLINTTITHHDGSAILNLDGAFVSIKNSIIWGNGSYWDDGQSGTTQDHSLIQGRNNTDNNNIPGSTDPQFVDATNGDYRLSQASPAINAGSNRLLWGAIDDGHGEPTNPTDTRWGTDIEGNYRIMGGRVDMGAYESPYLTQEITDIVELEKTYGDVLFAPGSASSGLPLSYKSGDPEIAVAQNEGIQIVGVGTTEITVSQEGNAEYAAAKSVTFTLTVVPKALTVGNATASDRPYDGTNAITLSGAVLFGIVGDDELTLSEATTGTASEVFGDGLMVFTEMKLAGVDSDKYMLVQPQVTVNIRPYQLELSDFKADDKVYDGTTDVTGTGFDDNRITGDELEFSYTARFRDANTGVDKAVDYSDVIIMGGQHETYYVLAPTIGMATATIMPASQQSLRLGNDTVTYDGQPHSLTVSGQATDATVVYTINGMAGNTATNAGSYIVEAVVSRPNYQDSTLTAILLINRAQAEIAADELQQHVYDGTAKSAVATLNHGETSLVYSPQQSYTDAGVYTVTVTAEQTTNYLATDKVVTLQIDLADQQGLSFENDTVTYNGQPHSLLVNGQASDATVVYTINGMAGNTATNAGSYTVEAVVSRPNYADSTLTAILLINRAQAEITADEVQQHVYDGTAKSVVATLNHGETSLVYSPQQSYTDAGNYTVTVTAEQTSNYLATDKVVTLQIDLAEQQGLSFENDTVTYDGQPHSLVVSGAATEATVVYTINGMAGNTATNAGSYTVEAVVSRPNYADSTLTAILLINRAQAEITADEVQQHVYDGTAKSVVATLNHGETSLVYSPQQTYTDAGNYTVTVTAEQTSNYQATDKVVTLQIDLAEQQGLSFENDTVTYDGQPHSLTVSGQATEATVVYTINGMAGNTATNAGSYTVEAVVSRPNYADSTLTAILLINRAQAEIAADEVQQHVYDGTAKSVVATLNHGETSLVYSPQQSYTDAGNYTVTVTAEQTSNYLATDKVVTLQIDLAEQQGLSFENDTVTYDGQPHSLVVSGAATEATVVYTINGMAGNTATNAGSYTVEAVVSRPNYADSTLTAILLINRAQAEIAADELQQHVYDGTAKSVVATLNHGETSLVYSPQQSYTDAGVYTVTVTAEQTTNYLATDKVVTLQIDLAEQQGLSFENDTVTYDGQPHSLTVSGQATDATVVYTINGMTGNEATNAGSYIVEVVVSRPNYKDSTLTAILLINRAQAVITADELQQHVYDGTAKSVMASLNHGETSLVYSPRQSYTDAGVYTVTVTADQTTNYRAVTRTLILRINQASVGDIKLANRNYIYDGNMKSLVIEGTMPEGVIVEYSNNGRTNVGSQEVTATITGQDYQTIILTGVLSIVPADLYVNVVSESKLLGSRDPEFFYTIDGLVKDDTQEEVISGMPLRATGETEGDYVIGRGNLSVSDNYTLHFNAGILSIQKGVNIRDIFFDAIIQGGEDVWIPLELANSWLEAYPTGAPMRLSIENGHGFEVVDIRSDRFTIRKQGDDWILEAIDEWLPSVEYRLDVQLRGNGRFAGISHLTVLAWNPVNAGIEPDSRVHLDIPVEEGDYAIMASNVFTPNGDGINDAFVFDGLERHDRAELTILSRFGDQIYRDMDYKNDWTAPNVQDGTYFYVLEVYRYSSIQGRMVRSFFRGSVLIKRE